MADKQTSSKKPVDYGEVLVEALKRTPGNILGGGVDVANLLLGLVTGKGLKGFVDNPVGGSESINQAVGLKQGQDPAQQAAEAVLGMFSPGSMVAQAAKTAGIGGAAVLGMLKTLNAGGAKPTGKGAKETGAILLHGGAKPITTPDPTLIPNVDYQAVFGPGFYTTNELVTPFKSAMKSTKNTGGTISVFDLPDEKYAATLKLSTEPISKQPAVEAGLTKLIQNEPKIAQIIIDYANFRRQGTGQTIDQTVTGELIEDALRSVYGRENTYKKLAEYGIPGRTWQYSASSPEAATLVFREAYPELVSLGQFSVTPGSEGFKAAQQQLQNLLGQQRK